MRTNLCSPTPFDDKGDTGPLAGIAVLQIAFLGILFWNQASSMTNFTKLSARLNRVNACLRRRNDRCDFYSWMVSLRSTAPCAQSF
jgi:hypothetical protein